jgi:hypothetical protein
LRVSLDYLVGNVRISAYMLKNLPVHEPSKHFSRRWPALSRKPLSVTHADLGVFCDEIYASLFVFRKGMGDLRAQQLCNI